MWFHDSQEASVPSRVHSILKMRLKFMAVSRIAPRDGFFDRSNLLGPTYKTKTCCLERKKRSLLVFKRVDQFM
jgi:hypothetical protein